MLRKKVGIIVSIFLSYSPILAQKIKVDSDLNFISKQFETFKHDLHIINKCYFSRNCSAQEKKDAQTALLRVTIEGATIIALIWGTHFVYKKIAIKNALETLTSHKAILFKQEASGAVGADPEIMTQFVQNILGTNTVYVGDTFLTGAGGITMQDIISSSRADDIPVGRPIYDKSGALIGSVGIRPLSKQEIGMVLYKNAPSSYHTKLNNMRNVIAGTSFDHQVNHWPRIFDREWGMSGKENHPGAGEATPQRVIAQLMNWGDIRSYALINLKK